MRQFTAGILDNEEISPSWRRLAFSWPDDLEPPLPGQFFTFRPTAIEPGDSGLLRRPLAFAGFKEGIAQTVYQVRGPGTRALASLGRGSPLDLLAPLGKAFAEPGPGAAAVLVGGGVGIGPMLYLHRRLSRVMDAASILLVLGFREASQIPALGDSELSSSFAEAFVATDDGSRGFRGRAAEAAAEAAGARFRGWRAADLRYYACGPAPMLAAVASLAAAGASPCQVSVEQWMACGVGACYGCVLPAAAGGYLRACADGPVFDAAALDWGRMT